MAAPPGSDRSAAATADAAAAILGQLCHRLATLVGDSGIAAVLHRAWKEHAVAMGPSAEARGPVLGWAARVARIAEQLRLMSPDLARETAGAVVSSFVATVCTFIGESLTVRLMQDLWPEIVAATKDPT